MSGTAYTPHSIVPAAPDGRLAENVMHFGRMLRTAGMQVSSDRITLALQALKIAGLENRHDLHDVLATCFVLSASERQLFDQAFYLFWRDPDLLGRAMALLLPRVEGPEHQLPHRQNRRLADALFPGGPAPRQTEEPPPKIEIEATLTVSDREVLRKADFDSMSAQEWQAAKRLIAQQRMSLPRVRVRRFCPSSNGETLDWRRVVASSVRNGGELALLARRTRKEQTAPVVALVDISGSMSQYSRMFLHYLHAMTDADRRTHTFVFGTRLTNITRALRQRDPDLAVAASVSAVEDWSGGTRISSSLHLFNKLWSRRVLGQNATVLLVTDGLERDDAGQLAFEAERLGKSCRRLLWLNPLLRYDAFEPRAAGIRAILPHVDQHLPVHNLESLDALSQALAGKPQGR